MKKKRVWRYYCEYCKKSGCSGGHMKRHEASCTNNPNRFCRMCHIAGFTQQPIEKLIEALGDGKDMTAIRRLSENCPACMLAAIRQSKCVYIYDPEDFFDPLDWDSEQFSFSKEKKSFWDSVNQNNLERGYY